MAKKFNISLTGYVGGRDFDRRKVSDCLRDNADNEVSVLIDSTGGSLATALSIASGFKNHGAVNVHFVGLNASAATVASLGARTITMDRSAMYLVHKVSTSVFQWADMNADELDTWINEMLKQKQDLQKLDENIAAMYAARCSKDKKDLLELMKKESWLSAEEALAWGFIDKITDYPDDQEPQLTNSMAADLNNAGIPLPFEPKQKKPAAGPISRIIESVKEFLTPESASKDGEPTDEAKTQSHADTTDTTEQKPATAPKNKKKEPAAKTTSVIDSKPSGSGSGDSLSDYVDTMTRARETFNSLP